jgi:hypothetical protein
MSRTLSITSALLAAAMLLALVSAVAVGYWVEGQLGQVDFSALLAPLVAH